MPFFRKNKKNVTLQVRIPKLLANKLYIVLNKYIKFSEKRVLSFTSSYKGSLTVEAAFGLSLFLFAIVTLMMPLKFLNQQRLIQANLEAVAEEASQYAYVLYRLEQGDEDVLHGTGDWKQEFLQKYAKSSAVIMYAAFRMSGQVDKTLIGNISFLDSEILSDGEHIDLVMKYEMKLPFSVFGLKGISQTSRSFRRGWVGRNGGKFGTDGDGVNSDEKIVFIGKSGTRYHVIRTCHYLYNDLKSVDLNDINDFRNASGGIYKPCSICKGQISAGIVYVMPSGSRYHGDAACKAIVAYVEAVPLSTVEHLGPCTYCSK